MTDWIILRTAPGSTLRLAESLADAGFEVWTPAETKVRRRPRSQMEIEVRLPVIPGFVFAGADRLADLLTLARSPALTYRVWDNDLRRMVARGHPQFLLFRQHGACPTLADSSLRALREIEARLAVATDRRRERERQRGATPVFVAGETVRAGSGGFEGLDLIVVRQDRKMVAVTFPGWSIPLQISPWHLQAVRVASAAPIAA